VRNPLSFVVFVQEIADLDEVVEVGRIKHDLFKNRIDDKWRPGVPSGPYSPPLKEGDDLSSRGEDLLRSKLARKWTYRIAGLVIGEDRRDADQGEK
jgi:hypothetical protein